MADSYERSSGQAGRNRALFYRTAGVDPRRVATMFPVHGTDILEATVYHMDVMPRCDGLYTSDRSIALSVRIADCSFVMATSEDYAFLMVLHVGTLGANAGILPKALIVARDKFFVGPERLKIGVGPVICKNCYDSPGTIKALREEKRWERFLSLGDDGERRCDLRGYIVDQLVNEGILARNLTVAAECPCCARFENDNPIFASHRRIEQRKKQQKGEEKLTEYEGRFLAVAKLIPAL